MHSYVDYDGLDQLVLLWLGFGSTFSVLIVFDSVSSFKSLAFTVYTQDKRQVSNLVIFSRHVLAILSKKFNENSIFPYPFVKCLAGLSYVLFLAGSVCKAKLDKKIWSDMLSADVLSSWSEDRLVYVQYVYCKVF